MLVLSETKLKGKRELVFGGLGVGNQGLMRGLGQGKGYVCW